MITACEAITVAAVASTTIGSCAQLGSQQEERALDDASRCPAAARPGRSSSARSAGSTSASQPQVIGARPKWPMSAYSASAPVTASTTAASAKNAMWKWPNMKSERIRRRQRPQDLRVRERSRARRSAPMTTNHTTITGPKNRPTIAVPCRCTTNRPMMITAVIGTTSSASLGSTTFRPSTADSTEIAGVIMLSPKNSAAPRIPSADSTPDDACTRPLAEPAHQRDQRHDAALAVVVGAHHQRDVGEGDDDHHRPEDQRHHAVDVVDVHRHRMRIVRD